MIVEDGPSTPHKVILEVASVRLQLEMPVYMPALKSIVSPKLASESIFTKPPDSGESENFAGALSY
jgi:hypothetical protein